MSDSASCSPTRRRKRVGRGMSWRSAGWIGQIDDVAVGSYFDELLRARTWVSRPWVVTRSFAISFARRLTTKEREFLEEESRYHGTFSHVHVHASRNLSNDRSKQRRDSTAKTVGERGRRISMHQVQMLVEEKLSSRTELIITRVAWIQNTNWNHTKSCHVDYFILPKIVEDACVISLAFRATRY